MQVALDLTPTIAGATGVARYARSLHVALQANGIEVHPYTIGRGSFAAPEGTKRIGIPLRVMHKSWSRLGYPPIDWFVGSCDAIHTLDMQAPPTRRPSVATVHDLDAIDHPALHGERATATQTAQIRSLRRATVVICDSETTRRAVAKHGVAGDHVLVVPLGVTALADAEPASFAGVDRYVLCVGTIDARKGQDVLIRAMAAVPTATAIFVGPDGWGAEGIRALPAELGVEQRVRFLGRVDEQRLAALYRGAAVFCFPSRAEGFGLPVLEAMAEGVPVVASDIDVIREVSDGNAVLVTSDDPSALAEGLDRALTDEALRTSLSAAGRTRANAFSWDRTGRATIAAYELAIELHRSRL